MMINGVIFNLLMLQHINVSLMISNQLVEIWKVFAYSMEICALEVHVTPEVS